MIRKAVKEDIFELERIYSFAREYMKKTNNPNQWGDDRPTRTAILKDIFSGKMYVIEENDKIVAGFSLIEEDLDYEDIMGAWINNEPYLAIHKVASDGTTRGVFNKILQFTKNKTKNIRIDTHKNNRIMQLLIKRNGFRYCGIVYIEKALERLAYHYVNDDK